MNGLAILLLVVGCDLFRRDDGPAPVETDTDDTDAEVILPYGADCSANPDACDSGMVCAGDGTCTAIGEAGTSALGEPCIGNEWCQFDMACNAEGICDTIGAPGTAGIGESCSDDTDCQMFLNCEKGACFGFQPPLWRGVTCSDPAAEVGAFRVYFEVPQFGSSLNEFYRLPIPNDIRIKDGYMSLAGHPTPGVLIEDLGDVAAEVISLMEQEIGAWGNNEAVFFRFSHDVNSNSLSLGKPGEGSVGIVNITSSSPDYGSRHGGGYRYSGRARQYICHNWISLQPSTGSPFRPGETYAAIITTEVTQAETGMPVAQDADFTALLSASAPVDDRLTHAWEVYEPFRAYLTDQGIDSSTIAAAAVFTVQEPQEPLQDLWAAVQVADTPTESGTYLCQFDPGPYATKDDPDRGCDTSVSGDYHEIQGVVTLPQFQAGTPPFKNASDGGGIDFSLGPPTAVSTEDVVFSLTIPNYAMPAEGWPLVLYGHGTNGNYRSFVVDGTAGDLSLVTLDNGQRVRLAVLSIDAVNHGSRRHSENWEQRWLDIDPSAYDPDVLFFNPLNPTAGRDNVLQGAADYFALIRWVETVDWSSSTSVTGEEIRFDVDKLYYLGHSQGSTTGVGFVAHEPAIKAAVFSGAGGVLIESLLNKRNPFDLPAALTVGLADPELMRHHPLLNLAQAFSESADPVNHAQYVARYPQGSNEAKHVYHTYGIGDTYTPEETQYGLVRALRLNQITNGNAPLDYIDEVEAPVTNNRYQRTLVTSLFQPAGSNDGHFVLFDDALAERQYSHFLAGAVAEGDPTVVE